MANTVDIKVNLTPEAQARLDRIKELIDRNGELSLNEYQRRSMRTAGDLSHFETQLAVSGLGLAGESGEVADHIKKVVGHGHELDRDYVKKELGDALWYIQYTASLLGMTLEEVAQANIDKLMARYPEGFTHEASINRKDDEEPKGHYAIPHRCPEDCPVGTRL